MVRSQLQELARPSSAGLPGTGASVRSGRLTLSSSLGCVQTASSVSFWIFTPCFPFPFLSVLSGQSGGGCEGGH